MKDVGKLDKGSMKGTNYDVAMLSKFLSVTIKVYVPTMFWERNGVLHCKTPMIVGNGSNNELRLWLRKQHYEPIVNVYSVPL